MKRLRQLLACTCFLLTMNGSLAAAAEPSYESALADFRANRLRESVRSLRALLAKDPKNPEAAMLLGTLYYQNKKTKKAMEWFDKSDPKFLINDTAFAWGSTYLEYDEDKKAALGFKFLLKNKGPFRPLALYYLGVIAYNSAQWMKARKHFQKVEPDDLTADLRENRRRYLDDIKQQQDKMLDAIIGGTDSSIQNMSVMQPAPEMPLQPQEALPEVQKELNPSAVQPSENLEETYRWRYGFKPSLALIQQNHLLDNHAFNQDTVNLFAHREGLNGTLSYGNARRASAGLLGGLDYSLGNLGYQTKIDQLEYFTLEQTSGVFASKQSSNVTELSGFAILQPHVIWNFNESMRFQMNFGLRSYFPAYDYLQSWGQSSEQIGAYYDDGETELGIEIATIQAFDRQQQKTADDSAARIEGEQQFGEVRLNLQAYRWRTANAELFSFNRYRLTLADPQLRYRTGFASEVGGSGSLIFNVFSETSLQLRLEKSARQAPGGSKVNRLTRTEALESAAYGANKTLLSFNVPLGESASVTGSTAYHRLTDYHDSALGGDGLEQQEFQTEIEQILYHAGGVVAFAEWLRLSGSYTVTRNSFLGPNTESREFRQRNPDSIIDSSIYLEIAKSF